MSIIEVRIVEHPPCQGTSVAAVYSSSRSLAKPTRFKGLKWQSIVKSRASYDADPALFVGSSAEGFGDIDCWLYGLPACLGKEK